MSKPAEYVRHGILLPAIPGLPRSPTSKTLGAFSAHALNLNRLASLQIAVVVLLAIAAIVLVAARDNYTITLILALSLVCFTVLVNSYSRQQITQTGRILEETGKDVQTLQAIHEHIVRCIHSGVVTISPDNHITSFNQAAERITGYAAEEILGSTVDEIFGHLPMDSLRHGTETTNTPLRWEQAFRRKEGREVPLGFSGALLRDHEGNGLGHVFVFQDLTAYKQMEEELKRADRMAAIGELAAGLAHEIRNPLASLYGSVEILKRDLPLEGTKKRLMEIVLHESERLNELIAGFLQFANPFVTAKESVPLRALVEHTLTLIQNCSEWKTTITVATDIPQHVCIHGSRSQIEQILWNLLLNALQALPQGGEIQISAREKKTHSARSGSRGPIKPRLIEWVISDTGVGIPREHLKKIFDPFFTTKEHGSGLGLAVVYRIVEKHGGSIRVESTPGKGTTFAMVFPQTDPLWSKVERGGS